MFLLLSAVFVGNEAFTACLTCGDPTKFLPFCKLVLFFPETTISFFATYLTSNAYIRLIRLGVLLYDIQTILQQNILAQNPRPRIIFYRRVRHPRRTEALNLTAEAAHDSLQRLVSYDEILTIAAGLSPSVEAVAQVLLDIFQIGAGSPAGRHLPDFGARQVGFGRQPLLAVGADMQVVGGEGSTEFGTHRLFLQFFSSLLTNFNHSQSLPPSATNPPIFIRFPSTHSIPQIAFDKIIMSSTLQQFFSRSNLQSSNKQNLLRRIRQKSAVKDKCWQASRYFQALEQHDIEQQAKDHLSYLSEIDENLPLKKITIEEDVGTVSGWEGNQPNRQVPKFKVSTKRNFRGFSFWPNRRDSSLSKKPASSTDNYPNLPGSSELISIMHDDTLAGHRSPSLMVINLDRGHDILDNPRRVRQQRNRSEDRSSDKGSQSNLTTIIHQCHQRDQKGELRGQMKSTEIETLKMKILDNLNKETVINRSGNSFDFSQAKSSLTKRPRSSLNILKSKFPQQAKQPKQQHSTPAPGMPPRNPIKLSNLIQQIESSHNSIALKHHHMIPRRPRKLINPPQPRMTWHLANRPT